MVSAEGIRMYIQKITAIKEYLVPASAKQASNFNGLTSQYR